jgi:Peptidase S46
MFSPAPISNSVEVLMLTEMLKLWVEELGADHAVVAAILKGRTPAQAAEYYVCNSAIGKDIDLRKKLAGGGHATDSMVELARIIDGPGREYRKMYEDKVEAVLNGSASKIAQARYAIFGANEYPDATFTMRVTFGDVRGYKGLDGKFVAWQTDFAGLYKRATGVDPYKLPQRGWTQRARSR